jgi:hypothetical protein
MDAALQVLALAAVLFALQHALWRSGPLAAAGAFFVLPLVLTPYWIRESGFDAFLWIKLFSIVFCLCYGSVVRFTHLNKWRAARLFITVLLALNILEAAALSVYEGGVANWLNTAAALGLVLALLWNSNAATVDGERREPHYHISRLWLVGYTVWNAAFVYLNYPELTGHTVAVLGVPLVVGLIEPGRWLFARAVTLGLYLFALASFRPWMIAQLDASDWSNSIVGVIAALAALGVAVACVYQALTAVRSAALDSPPRTGRMTASLHLSRRAFPCPQ